MPETNNARAIVRRRLSDLVAEGRAYPSATVETRLHLTQLLPVLENARPRIGWRAVFLKAYAQVCSMRPELRQVAVGSVESGWYTHPHPVILTDISRQIVEETLWLVPLRPDSMGLIGLEEELRRLEQKPIESLAPFRRLLERQTPTSWLRRWFGGRTPMTGEQRAETMGTAAVLLAPSDGVSVAEFPLPVTSTVTFEALTPTGEVKVRYTFDVRILDTTTACHVLDDLREVLRYSILAELRYQQAFRAA